MILQLRPNDATSAFLGTHRHMSFGGAYERGDAWAVNHSVEVARSFSRSHDNPHACSLVMGIAAWLDYADAHRLRFEDAIGNDYVLGPEWACWGRALLGLLNGETGSLDRGTLDALIRDTLGKHEVEAEG